MNAAITRNTYGELVTTDATRALILAARSLAAKAASRGKLPAEFDNTTWGRSGKERGKKIGEARHHEVYDVASNWEKALVCVRSVECTRYGQKTTDKSYYIVATHGSGVRVNDANKAVAAKAAKSTGELGQAIEVCEGKAKLHIAKNETRTGYKLVRRNESGDLVSAWDGSPWALGVTRTEKATKNHTGGFYYYATPELAIAAAAKNDVFGNNRDHAGLVLVEVEVSGNEYRHPGEKRCATRIKPVCIVAELA